MLLNEYILIIKASSYTSYVIKIKDKIFPKGLKQYSCQSFHSHIPGTLVYVIPFGHHHQENPFPAQHYQKQKKSSPFEKMMKT